MSAWLETTSLVLIILTMTVGQLGLVIPIFPGNVVIWVAALVYGIVFGFGNLGGVLFALITLLMLIAVGADNLLMGAKAREKGAEWGSIIAALIGGVIFTFVFPPIGGIIAAPLILYLMEYRRIGDSKAATEVVKGLMLGLGMSFLARFALGLIMIGIWAGWAFFA
ncbi:MAG: DUF456 domain-containing protein [Anaerolineales bacterium]|nr:DUF456 domain-containing protein [Chloroflexota bacterium]MBL6980861.1 DUF456 domain-containing protein [Anaerolineales bacterium]